MDDPLNAARAMGLLMFVVVVGLILAAWAVAWMIRTYWLGRVGFLAAICLAAPIGLAAAAAQLAVVGSSQLVSPQTALSGVLMTLCIATYTAFNTLQEDKSEESADDGPEH